MAKSLDQLAGERTVHNTTVVHHGEKLILPENMKPMEAVEFLERYENEQQQVVAVSDSFDVLPQDGAYGLARVIAKVYGFAQSIPTPGFFGSEPPRMMKIAVSATERVEVPWGRIALPNVDGFIETSITRSRTGRLAFAIQGEVKRKDRGDIERLFTELHAYLKDNSIYRGRALKIRFRDEDNDVLPMPEPEFIDTDRIDDSKLVYAQDVHDAIDANLFTPITRIDDCIANNIAIKRGVLLGGKYGTGKTLAASVASKLAVKHGVTYIYSPRVAELRDAIEFAKQYQTGGCVVFCEDIDREVTGERSVAMDDILNILDGIDTKGQNIITVLTTNHLENINKAMLRPGRLDAIINVTPPDAKAVEKLVRLYGGAAINANEDLTSVGQVLDGQIPAVVEEVVKRAKLVQLSLTERGGKVEGITSEALERAANTMKTQIELLKDPEPEQPESLSAVMTDMMQGAVKTAMNGSKEAIATTNKKVSQIHGAVC